MYVHITNILQEKEGVDLKVRGSLTDPTIKSSDFIVMCGTDSNTLSDFFKWASLADGESELPVVFFYDEPGASVEDDLNDLLRFLSDRRRISVKIFDKILYSWTYRDIIGYIEVAIKKLERIVPEPQPVV
jgi:hypothetical protein